ncbi:unnamed protein product [Lymnaea stagnalis]|uniref:Uridine diphosphate glucose pyrophosphatase NUDT14 n=1 Tax=Lymnaea stagnalis TaxID=6523 RepID=A0AAV2HKR3_LYMST
MACGRSTVTPCGTNDSRSVLVEVDNTTDITVRSLVLMTMNPLIVGEGADAKNLDYSQLKVRDIKRVENGKLFSQYQEAKKMLFLNKWDINPPVWPGVENIGRSRENVVTTKLLEELNAQFMTRDLCSELNEHYLFHGTTGDVIESLTFNGFDVSKSSRDNMFGPGIYLTEKSVKADQYADSKNNRKQKGDELKMVLCRVLLGNAYALDGLKSTARCDCTIDWPGVWLPMEEISEFYLVPLKDSKFLVPKTIHFIQNGRKRAWDFITEHSDVSILLFNVTRNVFIFVKQFRPAVYLYNAEIERVDQDGNEVINTQKFPASLGVTIELCSGIVDRNEGLIQIAQAEVHEECGYHVPVEILHKITAFRNGSGASAALVTLFYAEVTDEMRVGKGGGLPEEGELIEVIELSVEETRRLILDETVNREPVMLLALQWFFHEIFPAKKDS